MKIGVPDGEIGFEVAFVVATAKFGGRNRPGDVVITSYQYIHADESN